MAGDFFDSNSYIYGFQIHYIFPSELYDNPDIMAFLSEIGMPLVGIMKCHENPAERSCGNASVTRSYLRLRGGVLPCSVLPSAGQAERFAAAALFGWGYYKMTALQHTGPVNGTIAPAGVANGASAPSGPTPQMRAGIEKFRHAIQLSVGQIVLATMNLPRYRHQTLADLTHLFVAPLMRDRVAIARAAAPDGSAGDESVVGIALWATVSDAVDTKISEQIKSGVFPVRLGAEDWVSGDIVWLLDVMAADARQATSVLANFRKLAGARRFKIAPLVTRLIDPEVATKLREAARGGTGEKAPLDA